MNLSILFGEINKFCIILEGFCVFFFVKMKYFVPWVLKTAYLAAAKNTPYSRIGKAEYTAFTKKIMKLLKVRIDQRKHLEKRGARTLCSDEVCDEYHSLTKLAKRLKMTKTHSDGWTIIGRVCEDYYTWVNYFRAEHPYWGRVWGDFEIEVFADFEQGYNDFIKNHAPEEWNYWDI